MQELQDVITSYFPSGQQYGKSMRLNYIVDTLTTNCRYIGLGQCTPVVYQWVGDHYQFVEYATIGSFLQEVFALAGWVDYRSRDAIEVYNQIHQRTNLPVENRQMINNYAHIVPFSSKYFNMVLNEQFDPDPDYYYLDTFKTEMNCSAECPRFRKFLDEILPDRQQQLKVLAFLCYCLTPRIDLQMAQCWVGCGSNGKTELSKIFDLMMPGFVAHIPFDMFMEKGNKFIGSELKNKYVNVGSELNPKSLTSSGTSCLKRWITNKTMRSEEKFGNPENILNLTKFLFDVNELPLPTSFTDYAFFRRFQIIEFNQNITEKTKNLMDSIWDEEGPQIARMIVSSYENMETLLAEDATEAERLWHLNTQSVFVFFELYCDAECQGQSPTDEVFEQYEQFCKLENKKPVNNRHFGRLLKKMGVNRLYDTGYDDYGIRGHYYNMTCTFNFLEEVANKKTQLESYIK